jgi:hypothetical protein
LRRSIRALLAGTTVALVVVMMSPIAYADAGLTLHPSGFGKKSQAKWAAGQGISDSNGHTSFALYFQKDTTTATFAAGVAVVNGIEDTPVSQLTGLSWEWRDDGHCGAGAPHWNIRLQRADGTQYTVFLGCVAGANVPDLVNPDWTITTFNASAIQAAVLAAGGSLADDIQSLVIVFDEGTDQGQGFVYLDNITVEVQGTPHVWTGPADNSSN